MDFYHLKPVGAIIDRPQITIIPQLFDAIKKLHCDEVATSPHKEKHMPLYLIYLIVLSLITFFVYVTDKKKAQKGAWRVPEATLLLLSFIGGAVGGYAAMQLARHKTKKWYFHLVNIIGILWQEILLFYLIKNPITLF